MPQTAASRALAGTNASGTALSSGLPTYAGSEHVTSGQSTDKQSADKAKSSRTDQDAANDPEAARFDRVVKGICTGC
jgi:hypothetical protein